MFKEIDYAGARPIEGYGPGFFRLGGEVLHQDVPEAFQQDAERGGGAVHPGAGAGEVAAATAVDALEGEAERTQPVGDEFEAAGILRRDGRTGDEFAGQGQRGLGGHVGEDSGVPGPDGHGLSCCRR